MTAPTEPTALRAWLDKAWDDHATAAPRVADELHARAATLPDDADGAEALRLAEHMLLAHLANTAALQRLIAAVPAGAALGPAVQRARVALAMLDGSDVPDVPERARWGALQNVVLALAARGDVARATQLLLADEAAAAAHPDKAAQTAYASTANNVALNLRLEPRGDAGRDALMLAAAQLSRRAWERAGTWMNCERADYQLAMCHAALGQGVQATGYASACLARCEAEGAEPGELFFAHECCVHAQRAAGAGALAAHHRAQMVALLAQVGDAGMRAWCEETLAATPA